MIMIDAGVYVVNFDNRHTPGKKARDGQRKAIYLNDFVAS